MLYKPKYRMKNTAMCVGSPPCIFGMYWVFQINMLLLFIIDGTGKIQYKKLLKMHTF